MAGNGQVSERRAASSRAMAMAGLSLAVLFWAVNTVLARGVVEDIPPMALSFYRWITAFAFLLPFAAGQFKRDYTEIRQNIGFLFLLAIPSVAVYNSVLYLGALYTTANNISLVVAAMPAIALGFAWAINREQPRLVQVTGIAVSLAGVGIIIGKGTWQTFADLQVNPGDLLILVSTTSWALYSVLLKKRQLNISPLSLLMTTITLGALSIFPFYLLEMRVAGGFEISASTALIFVYLGICPSILSYICWNHGVKVLGPSLAVIFVYLQPVFTAVIAFAVLGERLAGFHLSGGLLILVGLVLSSRASK